MTSRHYRAEGIVLRSFPTGEGALVVTLLQSDGSKLRAMAWGAQKLTSRMMGHLEPLTRVEMAVTRGRGMDSLAQVQSVESFTAVKSDLDATARALYLVELVDGFAAEGSANPSLYQLFLASLRSLAGSDQSDVVIAHFQWQLLTVCGFMPELFQCVECRRELTPGDHRFSIDLGGVLCGQCASTQPSAAPLSLPALKVLRHFHRSPALTAPRVNLSASLNAQLRGILDGTVRYWLDREVRSRRFMDQLDRKPAGAPMPSGHQHEPKF